MRQGPRMKRRTEEKMLLLKLSAILSLPVLEEAEKSRYCSSWRYGSSLKTCNSIVYICTIERSNVTKSRPAIKVSSNDNL